MFNSGISVKSLIDELTNEVDVALDIPAETYILWLNSLQQLLYTEIIKEQKKTTVDATTENLIDISSIGDENTRFEDIYTIYTDKNTQLIKTTVSSGVIFPNSFFKDNNNVGYNATPGTEKLTIVYFVKPALITVADENTKVMLPLEFIDLAKAKLRGEAYKLANEDSLAAKWLNDYNILLETFKAWITEKSPNFGL